MKKNMYSLILMEDVVREIDKIALQRNTNRSNLINQILAEYVSLMTPEKRISNIFQEIENMMNETRELIPFVMPNQQTMTLKSSLEYKYRPTIKYEVELYRIPDGAIGELKVIFRTQSAELLNALTAYFRLWKRLEDTYIAKYFTEQPISYQLYDGKFIRSIAIPTNRDYSNQDIADAIAAYIRMFDELMKGYLNGKYSAAELEARYISYLNQGTGLL